MRTHTVTLSSEQSSRLDVLVAEGHFASPAQALEQLLTQVLDETEISNYSPQALSHLRQGMAEADRGEFVPPEEINAFFDHWRRNG